MSRYPADGERRSDCRHRAADVERDAEQEGDDQPREGGVADGITDEREATQHDEGSDDGAHDPDEDRGDQAALHEPESHRVEQEIEEAHPRPSWK